MSHARKCCCCIPARLGTFVMSVVTLAEGTLIPLGGWYLVSHPVDVQVTQKQHLVLIFYSGACSLLVIISLLGLLGSLFKQRRMTGWYAALLQIHIAANLGLGIWFGYELFRDETQHGFNNCHSSNDVEGCNFRFNVFRGGVVALVVLTCIVELWSSIVAALYVRQFEVVEETTYEAVRMQEPLSYHIPMHPPPSISSHQGRPLSFHSQYPSSTSTDPYTLHPMSPPRSPRLPHSYPTPYGAPQSPRFGNRM
ncbi:hypothetical protein OF83DRAFT_1170205 [Amylostereum chailletii]|nr:hypothetical protein OF83DRAFT_1170205 [Amylostereum chailletii]